MEFRLTSHISRDYITVSGKVKGPPAGRTRELTAVADGHK